MKKLLMFALLLFWLLPASEILSEAEVFAQVDTAWVRHYNGPGNDQDSANAIAVDGSGNVYVTGRSEGSGTYDDYATIKYDPNGDTAWVRRYNGSGNSWDEACAIAVDGSGNAYVTGVSAGSGTSGDYATIKYYPNGDTAWVRRYNGPENLCDGAEAIAVDDSGNVYVTGWSYGSGTEEDYVTIKYYPNGDTAWVRRYNGPGNDGDKAFAIAVDDSGNVYVAGTSDGIGTRSDYATIKYNPNGDTTWVRRYNGSGSSSDEARAIAVDGSGNVYVTGWSYGSGTGKDYATIKYYPNGDTAWVRRYNGPGNQWDSDRACDIAVDSSENVYVTGESSYGILGSGASSHRANCSDYATIKYYPDGDTAWVRIYNGPGEGAGYDWDNSSAIAVDNSGNFYVTGQSGGSGTYDDYATIKYNSSGNELWVKRYNGPGNSDDGASDIAVDDSGNVYVTGASGSGTSYDYATIKYVQWEPDSIPFAPAVYYAVGSELGGVFSTDLDGDGDYDLAVTCWYFPNVWILLNNGDGIFQEAIGHGAADSAYSIFSADFDGDGDHDLAVGGGHKVSILLNDGDASFPSADTYWVDDYVESIFSADLDQDGDYDLAVSFQGGFVSILVNNGDGSFHQGDLVATDGAARSVFSADLDDDGDYDLAAIGSTWPGPYYVSIFWNAGDATFHVASHYEVGDYELWSIFSANLDDDGDYDLAVGGWSKVWVLVNEDGVFDTIGSDVVGCRAMSLFSADLDGDRDCDLAVACDASGRVCILRNNGDGTFREAGRNDVGGWLSSLFSADFDKDGDYDLAVASLNGTVSILENLTQFSGNSPPDPFSLFSPGHGDTLSNTVDFDWATAYDPNLGDQIRYDLFISTSSEFHAESTIVDSNLVCSHHTDTLTAGSYYWKVKAKDNWGAETWSKDTWSFVVSGLAANFSASPESGVVPCTVQFTDLSSGNPISWFWDFGDDSTSTEQHPTHTYTDTGYFDVKLVVSNPQGTDSLTKEDYIHVLPSIPVLSWSNIIGYVTDGVSPDTGLTGTLFTFRVVYSDAYNLSPQSGYPKVNIDLNGDGDFEDENEGSFTMGVVDVDTNYVDGREYLYNATLPASSNCQYSFSAKNSYGLEAVGEPTNLKEGPVILDPAGALDLYIYASDITFSDPNPDEGDTFTVFATVHNNSDSNVSNVSVNFYHSGDTLNQLLIPNISPHSSATTSIPLSFDYEGFYPIRVVVDEENSFEEWNELNNFAIRPITVGDYEFPGGIVVQAQLNSPVYPYSWITVIGNAHYTPEYLGVVSGATVSITIQETGYDTTVYTNDPGNFSVGFYGPSQAGNYSVKVEVTDYTLTGDTTLDLKVISQPGVDLAIRIDLSDCLSENQEDTVRTEIFNLGDQDAGNFWTCIYKDASLYHCYWVDQLPAGDSLEIDTVISFSSTGWHTVTGIVDVGDSVSEYNEGNNVHTISRYVRCNGPDITIINVVFSDHTPKGEQPIDITAWVVNLGGVAVSETFGVEFSDNGIPFDTQYVTSLAPCEMETAYVVSDSFVYSDTIQHSFSIFADFEDVIAECDEENNVWQSDGGGPCIDLKIVYQDVGFSNTNPQSDTVRIMAKVFNLGDISAFNSKVRFKIDGVQIGQDVTIDTIHPDSFETVFSSDTWQVDLSACSLLVEADPEDLIIECDESNNLAYCPLPYDLYPYYRSTCRVNYPYVFSICHPVVDDSLTIFGVLRNRGGFDITGQVEIEVTDDVEGLLGHITVDSVLNHESNIASGSLRHAFAHYGWHTVTLHADYDSQYYECGREDNNCYSASIFVDILRPDLEVRSEYIEFSDDCPTWDDSLWFFVTTYNIGQGVAENVQVRFLVDEDTVGEDILIDSIPVGPNNYHTDSSAAPWIVPEKFDVTHVCKIVVDPDNEILEESEDNNEATRALPVVRCGDVNQDCIVNIADVVYLINYLFIEGPPPFPFPAADVNTDGEVNIADVVYLINYLFIGGPPPQCG